MAIEKTQMRSALDRAERIIQQMAPYIGKMAVPAEFFADLNQHWLFVEALKRAEKALKR